MDRIERKKDRYSNSTAFAFLLYWLVLVIWQNTGMTTVRTGMDLMIKIVLILFLTAFFIKRATTVGVNLVGIIAFAITMLATFALEAKFSLGGLISYIFPPLFALLTYGIGNRFCITQRHLLIFLHGVILTALYACIYALLFCFDQFRTAFQISSAYGNELKSFFVSSHEYGMYLLYAIVSCMICLEFRKKSISRNVVLLYYAAITLFAVCLILTYSRTAMFAALVFLGVYLCLAPKSKLKKHAVIALALAICFAFLVPVLRMFIYTIVMKENYISDRTRLNNLALDTFTQGHFLQKVFGHGASETQDIVAAHTGNRSFHNAYLQALVAYGLSGLIFLLTYIFSQIKLHIKTIKKDRFMGAVSLALIFSACALMLTNTTVLFTSPIDSYFLTVFTFIIPKYVRNAIDKGVFN